MEDSKKISVDRMRIGHIIICQTGYSGFRVYRYATYFTILIVTPVFSIGILSEIGYNKLRR